MKKLSLEEKVKLSEKLVDRYLDEFVTATTVGLSLAAMNTARGLGNDAARLLAAYKKKQEEKKRQMMIAKQHKEKEKQQSQNTA